MARFLVLPFHIVSSILGAGSRPLCARALTAGEPPTAQAVMVSPVTLSPSPCDPSTATPQITPTRSTSPESSKWMFACLSWTFARPWASVHAHRSHDHACAAEPMSFTRGPEGKKLGGFHGSHAS